jgi:hypothetical protein
LFGTEQGTGGRQLPPSQSEIFFEKKVRTRTQQDLSELTPVKATRLNREGVMLSYEQMDALDKRVRELLPYYDGADFQPDDDGTYTVVGVDVDVDICPMTGRNRCHGVDYTPLWKVNSRGEILEVLYEDEENP